MLIYFSAACVPLNASFTNPAICKITYLNLLKKGKGKERKKHSPHPPHPLIYSHTHPLLTRPLSPRTPSFSHLSHPF